MLPNFPASGAPNVKTMGKPRQRASPPLLGGGKSMSGAANAGDPRKAELKFSGFLLGRGGGFKNKGTPERRAKRELRHHPLWYHLTTEKTETRTAAWCLGPGSDFPWAVTPLVTPSRPQPDPTAQACPFSQKASPLNVQGEGRTAWCLASSGVTRLTGSSRSDIA